MKWLSIMFTVQSIALGIWSAIHHEAPSALVAGWATGVWMMHVIDDWSAK